MSDDVGYLNRANAFTFLRVALVPVFAWLLLDQAPGWAALVFVAAAATDGVDGYVARRYDLVSGFGQFLDPLADKLLVGTALVALAVDGRMPWWAVVVILVREFGVMGLRVVMARAGRALPASRASKLKTASQIAAVVMLTLRAQGDAVAMGFLMVAVALTVVSGIQYLVDVVAGRAGEEWR